MDFQYWKRFTMVTRDKEIDENFNMSHLVEGSFNYFGNFVFSSSKDFKKQTKSSNRQFTEFINFSNKGIDYYFCF